MIRVLLADDHQLLIDGLRTLLERQRSFEVIGIARDGLEAVQIARDQAPDVILLDISMPRLNGVDAARRILRHHPDVKIIMLSMHDDRRFIRESMRVGARGYILKESAVGEVIEAIRAVHKGRLYFSETVREQVLHDYVEGVRADDDPSTSPLSGREREVLQILTEGRSTKDAAAILNVSVKTIESHRKQIMDKLDLHSMAELTKYAIREGITQLR